MYILSPTVIGVCFNQLKYECKISWDDIDTEIVGY